MCLQEKEFWLFWLTFVSLYQNPLNAKAEHSSVPIHQLKSHVEAPKTITTATVKNNTSSANPALEHELSVANALSSNAYETAQTNNAIEGRVKEAGHANVTEVLPKLRNFTNFKNLKISAKTISDNFNWDLKKNVEQFLQNSAQKQNQKKSAVGSSIETETPNSNRSNTIFIEQRNSNAPARRHLVLEKLQYTKEIAIKQGRLVGIVRSFQSNSGLRNVDQYLGLPYGEAPTGSRRFMPPGTPLPWSGLKIARHLPPVCLQMLPDISVQSNGKLSRSRLKYLSRLMPYLQNESEDCLYLNVYVPKEDVSQHGHLYPVIVYIHGESFNWNSGNAYDGSVLASYGRVIVVTVNYRLGLMGFLKPGISDSTIANFGLLDQIAALHWIKENIIAFSGDKDKVTLMGHGTGAACVNYLMISPVASGLFHRAVLMSGSAMSDWASSNHSLEITMQIAGTLDCPINDDNDQMMSCFRQKSYQELLKVSNEFPEFSTTLGPIIDGHVIPDQPYKAMGQYTEFFSRYDLLFGITESEAYHVLGPSALQEGLRENERNNYLRFYMRSRYNIRPDLALAAALKKYNDMYNNPNRATNLEHRDVVLDILSDARIVGPLMQTGLFHSEVNRHNYMYVFGHNSATGPYASLPHSIAGEEIAFLFGAPMSPAGIFHGNNYSEQEKLLSEAVMTYWTNFAKTGNPKGPWKGTFLNLHALEWERYDLDWPEFNKRNQAYLNIGIPPSIGFKYRQIYMNFWNKELPDEMNQIAEIQKQPFIFGQYLRNSSETLSAQNFSTRRPSSEVITGHLNKFGMRDYGSEDPVRTLKLLMQEAGQTIPMSSDVEADNINNMPSTLGKRKQSEKEVFGIQTVSNIMHTYKFSGKEEDSSPDNNRVYGVKNEESGKNENGNNIVEGTVISGVSTGKENGREEVAKSESTLQLLIGLIVLFITLNIIIYTTFLLQKRRKKQACTLRKLGGILSYDGTTDDELKRSKQTTQNDGDESYILDVVRKSNTYEAVRSLERSPINGFKLSKQLSTSTIDTHTKVSEWISTVAGGSSKAKTFMRFPKVSDKSGSPEFSTLGGNSGGCLTRTGSFAMSPKHVSVAIDATPQARSNSVLCQEPIELTKLKAEGGKIIICEDIEVSDHQLLGPQLSLDATDCVVLRQDAMSNGAVSKHTCPFRQYSISDPIDIYYCNLSFDDEKITSFMDDVDKFSDINVTSRNEATENLASLLTSDQRLLAIKRRNYPKVLPTRTTEGELRGTDSPPMTIDLSTTICKRNSLPSNSFLPMSCDKSIAPPAPPPRTISTLGRIPVKEQRRESNDLTTSPLRLARISIWEENEMTPQIAENTLIVGPIVPKLKASAVVGNKETNYIAIKSSEGETDNSAQENANTEVNALDQEQKQTSATSHSAFCFQSLTPSYVGLFEKFESFHQDTDLNMQQHKKPEDFHTTERIYTIEGKSEIPITPTNLNRYSKMSSAAEIPSTASETLPEYFTHASCAMAATREKRLYDGIAKDSTGGSSKTAIEQSSKQPLKENDNSKKSNIPLRVLTPSLTISRLSLQDDLGSNLISAKNSHFAGKYNQVQAVEVPESIIYSEKSRLDALSQSEIGDSAYLNANEKQSAIPSRIPYFNRGSNIKQEHTQNFIKNLSSSDEVGSPMSLMKTLSMKQHLNISNTNAEGTSQFYDISHQIQELKTALRASTGSSTSSSDCSKNRTTTISTSDTDSNSSSSSSTKTVRTELKQK